MPDHELEQLEILARVDDLTSRVTRWASADTPWQPVRGCQALLNRVLDRVDTLRIRLQAPVVAATFGGTGTGKSTLVNALVGEDCTETGRERPTTRRPVLIAHNDVDLDLLQIPLEDFDVVRRDADLLRDVILIDCPDPDTSEAGTPGSNLERLRALLPLCDVLIYTSTQQKYRSARVTDELGQAAEGCRLVFVQTHADLDEDIRDDWRGRLSGHFEVPDIYFINSHRGLIEQQEGRQPTGDLRRLQDLLKSEFSTSQRVIVRRANVADLCAGGLARCRGILTDSEPHVNDLQAALKTHRDTLHGELCVRIREELTGSRNLWERRLLSAVTDSWGFSPFSAVLRLYNGLGTLIASFTFFRARSAAQMAIVGAVQGARWWKQQRSEQQSEQQVRSAFLLNESMLRESEMVMQGHLHSSGLADDAIDKHSLTDLQQRAVVVEGEFLDDVAQRTDDIIDVLAVRNSRWYVRAFYEVAFLLYVGFVLYRVGRNFFMDSWLGDAPLLATDFYIPAGLFLLIWSLLLVTAFVHRLRRGLNRAVDAAAAELVARQLAHGLFPDLESQCELFRRQQHELEALLESAERQRRAIAGSPGLGGVHLAREEIRQPDSPGAPAVG